MNNGLNIHHNGLQPPATAAEQLVSARKQSPALKSISRHNFPWTMTLTHLFNTQIHSNNTVALTTAVQRPNKGRCLQLGYRVVSSRSQFAFIVLNQTIRLLRCLFLKTEKIAKWKLLSIAWDIFNLKFTLEKKVLLAYNEIVCLTEMKCHVQSPCTVRRPSINTTHWTMRSFHKLKQIVAYMWEWKDFHLKCLWQLKKKNLWYLKIIFFLLSGIKE